MVILKPFLSNWRATHKKGIRRLINVSNDLPKDYVQFSKARNFILNSSEVKLG